MRPRRPFSFARMGHAPETGTVVKSRRRSTANDPVDCMCWCEARVVQVTWSDVAHGITKSCGFPGCEPREVAAR